MGILSVFLICINFLSYLLICEIRFSSTQYILLQNYPACCVVCMFFSCINFCFLLKKSDHVSKYVCLYFVPYLGLYYEHSDFLASCFTTFALRKNNFNLIIITDYQNVYLDKSLISLYLVYTLL